MALNKTILSSAIKKALTQTKTFPEFDPETGKQLGVKTTLFGPTQEFTDALAEEIISHFTTFAQLTANTPTLTIGVPAIVVGVGGGVPGPVTGTATGGGITGALTPGWLS